MKSCVFGTLFLVIFLSYIHPGFGITTLDDDTYEIFVQMVKGEFTIPVKERTAQQNAARVRFWRNKDKLSLQGGMLCYSGVSERNVHEVLSKSTVHQKLNARFENRARLRPIRARDCSDTTPDRLSRHGKTKN